MRKIIFGIMLGLLMVGIVSAQDDVEIIDMNTSFVGEFTDEVSSITVGFEGTAGEVIYISALDEIVPVEFTLLSPTGGQLAQSVNSLIRNIELGSDGQYTIAFNRPEWSQDEGEFIAHLGAYILESLTEIDDGTALTYSGDLADAGAQQQFALDATEGDVVTIALYGANLGFTIQSPDDDYLLFEGVYNDPFVQLFQFPIAGTYTLTIITSEPDGTELEFFIYRHDPIRVTSNEPLTGELEENLPVVFALESAASKMWDINAILPLNGERYMTVHQFGDREFWETRIAEDGGSGPEGQPRIRPFIPNIDGTYYIALWYDDWDTEYETYEYQLIVSPSTLLSIPNNSPIKGEINIETGVAQYAYSGIKGDTISITFTKLSADGVLSLGMYSSEDEVVTFTGRNAISSRFDVVLPVDGIYQFEIFNASYDMESTLEFEILIEPMNS